MNDFLIPHNLASMSFFPHKDQLIAFKFSLASSFSLYLSVREGGKRKMDSLLNLNGDFILPLFFITFLTGSIW